tara:strand:+ start:13722 stop:14246 length:525 start_codon:yes stop_codon:yes gene_type:complete
MISSVNSHNPFQDFTGVQNKRQKQSSFDHEIEKSHEKQEAQASTISFQKELTPEEEQRVLFLQNMLSQLLSLADGRPSEEQRERIKEIEKELEELTGVKMETRLSSVTEKMPGKKEEKAENEESLVQQFGIDPDEAKHKQSAAPSGEAVPGIQMLKRQSLFAQLQSLLGPQLDQ